MINLKLYLSKVNNTKFSSLVLQNLTTIQDKLSQQKNSGDLVIDLIGLDYRKTLDRISS